MSTFVTFAPSTTSAFTFQPVLAGVQYNATVTWNIFGQRYYLNLYDLAGNLVLATAIVASGPVISSTFQWAATGGGLATITTEAPHNVPIGQLASVRVALTDSAFDGDWQVLSTGPTTLTYALGNPSSNQPLTGQISFDLNIAAPLGAGRLLYHYSTQQFEFE